MEALLAIYEKPLKLRSRWSVWTGSRWCCTPMSGRRGPCGGGGLPQRDSEYQRRGTANVLFCGVQHQTGRHFTEPLRKHPLSSAVRRLLVEIVANIKRLALSIW